MNTKVKQTIGNFYISYFGLDQDDSGLQLLINRLLNFTNTFLLKEFDVNVNNLSEQQLNCILPTLAEFMNLAYQAHPMFNENFGIVKEKLGNWELQYSGTFSKDKVAMLSDVLKDGLTTCNIYQKPSRIVRTYNSCVGCCNATNKR